MGHDDDADFNIFTFCENMQWFWEYVLAIFGFYRFFAFLCKKPKGEVQSISPAPTEEGVYVLEISLPEGLRTNYGKQLPVAKELKGSADVILADRNVLERLLAPLRKVVSYEH